MKRFINFAYGIVAYAVGMGGLTYFIFFLANLLVPNTLDGEVNMGFWPALGINLGLVVLFGLQHSIMARKSFKNWTRKFMPQAVERSTFVLFSGIFLFILLSFWQPMGGVIWDLSGSAASTLLLVLYFLGWAIVVGSSFLINHFELFGLRQVYFNLIQKPQPGPKFVQPALYKYVRHPLYFGLLLAFWSAPVMTVTHMILSAAMTSYIFIGISYEEKDLLAELGDSYRFYKEQVPMIIPFTKFRPKTKTAEPVSAE